MADNRCTSKIGARGAQNPKRAFTLLELLVVIGIITLLISLAAIGFRVVGAAMKSRLTGVQLENCKGLLTEYTQTSSVDQLLDTGTVTAMNSLRWYPSANGGTPSVGNALATAPDVVRATGTVEASVNQRQINDRYLRDETARVIRRLMSVPANRKSIESMSADRLTKVRYPADPTTVLSSASDPPEYPAAATNMLDGLNLLDGYGHPIYFIPGGGLRYVVSSYKGTGDRADPTNYEQQILVRAPDKGPFWASAGPDGDLTTGDDNEYSFGK